MTSDGVLICMHDLSYDRTTTGKGVIAAQPSSVLSRIGIRQPQLGPAWVQSPLPEIPRLETVLKEFGGKVVICLEAKDDRAYPSMMAMVARLGLLDSVDRQGLPHQRPDTAGQGGRAAGLLLPQPGRHERAHHRQRRPPGWIRDDLLVLPADNGDYVTYYPDALIAAAKAHRVPLLVYPIHRRADAEHYFKLGVSGAVTSDYGYTTTTTAAATTDSWAGKRISSGEKPKMPDSRSLAGAWTSLNELTLGAEGDPAVRHPRPAVPDRRGGLAVPADVLRGLEPAAGGPVGACCRWPSAISMTATTRTG